jgi:hypothetical protein
MDTGNQPGGAGGEVEAARWGRHAGWLGEAEVAARLVAGSWRGVS